MEVLTYLVCVYVCRFGIRSWTLTSLANMGKTNLEKSTRLTCFFWSCCDGDRWIRTQSCKSFAVSFLFLTLGWFFLSPMIMEWCKGVCELYVCRTLKIASLFKTYQEALSYYYYMLHLCSFLSSYQCFENQPATETVTCPSYRSWPSGLL